MPDIFDTLPDIQSGGTAVAQGDIFDQIAPDAPTRPPMQFKTNEEAHKAMMMARNNLGREQINNQGPLPYMNAVGQSLARLPGLITSVPAQRVIDFQKGDQQNSLANLHKVITGQLSPDYTDVAKGAGLKGLAATIPGIAGDVALYPGGAEGLVGLGELGVAGAKGAANIAAKGAQVAKNAITPKPADLIAKAQKMTTEILQPSKTELASSLNMDKQLPAIEQATKIITKSKDYGDLQNNINNVIKNSFLERNKILAQNNFKVNDDYLKEAKDLIAKTSSTGQATPEEINAMQSVITREEQFIKNNPNFNRLQAQSRKEHLQDLTHKLLERRESGDIVDRDPARNLALDAIRKGLRRVVNDGDPQIEKINDTYGGLKDAKWLVSGQEALARKAVPENILQRAISFITRPHDIPGEIARSALDRQGSLLNKTKKIDRLMRKAGAKP